MTRNQADPSNFLSLSVALYSSVQISLHHIYIFIYINMLKIEPTSLPGVGQFRQDRRTSRDGAKERSCEQQDVNRESRYRSGRNKVVK